MSKISPTALFKFVPLIIILMVAVWFGLMLLSGGMEKIAAWYLLQLILPLTGLMGLIFAVIRAIVRKRFDRVGVLTGVVSLLAILPALMLFSPLPFPASLENMTPAVTVRLPANVSLKVAWGGDSAQVNYYVIASDQRWAYDFVVEPYFSGSATLTDYGCYSVPVVAPAAGLVIRAHDGEPEMLPGITSNNLAAPTGNHVFIQLDQTGTYLMIAHLKLGSVTVKTGQRVAEGQVIGQCGNSGNTSEPHIHIHHQRQDPTVNPLGFAEGLPLYFRDHNGPPMPEGGFTMVNGTPVPSGATVQHLAKP